MPQDASKDFFISYQQTDQAWAAWIGYQLEEAGFRVILQAWDFRPGSNFVLELDHATRAAQRTIAVLSPAYLAALSMQAEWAAAFVQDPTGQRGLLLPIRVEVCELTGLLAPIIAIDLVNLDETSAQEALHAGTSRERSKPIAPPKFPGSGLSPTTIHPVPFPGPAPASAPASSYHTASKLASSYHTQIETSQGMVMGEHNTVNINIVNYPQSLSYPPPDLDKGTLSISAPTPRVGSPLTDDLAPTPRVAAPLAGDMADQISNEEPANRPQQESQTVWSIPYPRNPYFTDRAKLLADLHNNLARTQAAALTQAQAISGLGGIGKTQIALEYAYRYGNQYRFVLWVSAATQESLLADFVKLADLLRAPGYDMQDQRTAVPAVRRWLTQQKDWLLILDNADDMQLVYSYLPTGDTRGHILLTTRAQAVGNFASAIEVTKLNKQESVKLLLRRAKRIAGSPAGRSRQKGRDEAEAIVAIMDGLPLAIDQAGGYIEEAGCSLADYLSMYQTNRGQLLGRKSLTFNYPETVATTWAISFQRIRQENPAAAALLQFLAFLAPDTIPEEIIARGADHFSDDLKSLVNDTFKLNEAIALLRHYSLIQRHPDEKILVIHRMVQTVIQDGMSLEEQRQWADRVIAIVGRVFSSTGLKGISEFERYMPQLSICADLIDRYSMESLTTAHLLYQAGAILQRYARYSETEGFYRRALRIIEKAEGKENLINILVWHKLGGLYHEQGQYAEAVTAFQIALDICEKALGNKRLRTAVQKVLGDGHLYSATLAEDMGQSYYYQGAYQKAEMLYKRAISLYDSAYDIKELDLPYPIPLPRKGVILLYLSELCETQGRYQEAEEYHKQALYHIDEDQVLELGLEGVARLKMLARLHRTHEHFFAKTDYKFLLLEYEATLGTEHPLTASTLHELGRHAWEQNNFEESAKYYQRALAIRKKTLGLEHPDTANTLLQLARLEQEQQNDRDAEAHFLQALDIYEKTLGAEHITTGAVAEELARLYDDQGKYNQAEPLFKRAISIYENVLGREHPDMVKTLNRLGLLYKAQGNYTYAKQFLQQVLTLQEKSPDANPGWTTQIQENLQVVMSLLEETDH